MTIQESGEMYLETILILSKKNNIVRATDIAEHMGFSKPAVSRALAKLREGDLILTDKSGYIALTENGRKIAEKIYDRHVVLTGFLMQLGVDEHTAEADACRIEHIVSDKTMAAMKKYVKAHK